MHLGLILHGQEEEPGRQRPPAGRRTCECSSAELGAGGLRRGGADVVGTGCSGGSRSEQRDDV